MSSKKRPDLILNRETIRLLSDEEAGAVVGGTGTYDPTCDISTCCTYVTPCVPVPAPCEALTKRRVE